MANPFRRIEDCNYCLFASDDSTHPCRARVSAPEGDRCLDFRPRQSNKPYPLSDRLPKNSIAKRLDLLNWHPLATGVCPECSEEISQSSAFIFQRWFCLICGWCTQENELT
ncbi:hypothetical protein [Synechococcus elongatus]|uniref:hypothetical protein n=1 Tax=Synechococcus elongatus TaxID=32046 RepID=UPI0030D2F2FB